MNFFYVAVAVRTRSSAKDGIPSEAGPARLGKILLLLFF